jgi:hypothetical protein
MKKIFAAALLAALTAIAAMPAHAATAILTGHIKSSNVVGANAASLDHPEVAQYVTQSSDPCTPGGAHAGEDGMWFALPDGVKKNMPAMLKFTDKTGVYPNGQGIDAGRSFPDLGRYPMVGTDMDVAWYDADCKALGDGGMALSSNPEIGAVPNGAAFVLVNYYMGLDDNDFTLTIG